MKKIGKTTISPAAGALLLFLIGAVLVVMPGTVRLLFCRIISFGAAIYGVLNIMTFFNESREILHVPELILGIVAAAFGAFGLFRPRTLTEVLYIAMGIAVIASSVFAICRALTLRSLGGSLWQLHLAVCCAALAVALTVVFHPVFYRNFVFRVVGAAMMVSSLNDLALIRRISSY